MVVVIVILPLKTALQEMVGERSKQILHAHFGSRLGDVFFVANEFHNTVASGWLLVATQPCFHTRCQSHLVDPSPANRGRDHVFSSHQPLVERPPRAAEIALVVFLSKALLLAMWRLLPCGENTLLTATDAFVSIQALEDECGCRNQQFRRLLPAQAEGAQLVEQALNSAQLVQHLLRASGVAKLNFTAEIEPLDDLVHVVIAVKVAIVSASDGGADDVARDMVGTFQLSLVFQFELAGDRRHSGVDVTDTWHHQLLARANCAALRV